MVCLSVSMRMFNYYEWLTPSDHFAIVNQMAIFVIMIGFIGLITYFTISVTAQLNTFHLNKNYELHH